MTEAAWRSLSLEASRLEHDLDEALARRRQELGTPGHEDPALPLWRIERAQENLETLQAVLGGARVVPADGRAVVGARVTLRVDGGTPESYAIVAPGEGDATRNRVPADSSLGEHLLGRRASARFVLKTPAGRRGYEVVAVEYPEEAWAPGRSSLPMGEAESPLVSAISRDLALVR